VTAFPAGTPSPIETGDGGRVQAPVQDPAGAGRARARAKELAMGTAPARPGQRARTTPAA